MTEKHPRRRLVIVSNMYPCQENPAYGVFVKRFADQMASHFDVTLIAMYKTPNRVQRLLRYVLLNVQLWTSLLRSAKAIHYVHYPLFLAPALRLAPWRNRQVVLNFHGTDNHINSPLKRLFSALLQQRIHRTRVVTPSSSLASDVARRYNLPLERIFISPSAGVDIVKYKAKTVPAGNRQRIGYVSALMAEKGWRNFIDLIVELRHRMSTDDLEVVMVGSGPDQQPLAAAITHHGLTIERHQLMPESSLADLYAGLSLLVFPSHRESLGLVGLEALACGTPVIAHRIPGPGDYIQHGVNGYLCDIGDIACMADHAEVVLNQPLGVKLALRGRCVASIDRYHSGYVSDSMRPFIQSVTPWTPPSRSAASAPARWHERHID